MAFSQSPQHNVLSDCALCCILYIQEIPTYQCVCMCLCVCIQGSEVGERGAGECSTKFQPNKALSVYYTTGGLWETLKGENTGLCLDDCMLDACLSLSLPFFSFSFLACCCSKKHSPFLLSSNGEKCLIFIHFSVSTFYIFPSTSALCLCDLLVLKQAGVYEVGFACVSLHSQFW